MGSSFRGPWNSKLLTPKFSSFPSLLQNLPISFRRDEKAAKGDNGPGKGIRSDSCKAHKISSISWANVFFYVIEPSDIDASEAWTKYMRSFSPSPARVRISVSYLVQLEVALQTDLIFSDRGSCTIFFFACDWQLTVPTHVQYLFECYFA